jgi:hypothetical protein
MVGLSVRGVLRLASLALVVSRCVVGADAQDAQLKPVRVCEILQDLAAYNGKTVLVVGRFSFRESGRYIAEDTCGQKLSSGGTGRAYTLVLVSDPKTGPKGPERIEIDAALLREKLKLVKASTALRKFRFGSPDYDRWAVVLGRIELSKESSPGTSGRADAAAMLLYRGEGLIVTISDE